MIFGKGKVSIVYSRLTEIDAHLRYSELADMGLDPKLIESEDGWTVEAEIGKCTDLLIEAKN